ncbi:autotransporter domain-containing protein [Sphingomonas changnyeongensis]|uniref:Autotransporter domain-containing protein n=1 Tax=Sphingomonas changnyeongensis TaxID=2698679 RepID=A0A7Z2NVA6_9SPHN|nr:autotransporter outer membrane beta-barrel domain-containing protein [Sphingomonas changnyeongensis]QHL90468.1 autotransporter domain-containing protein [Sphingomonas changnyeongensis]
MRRLLACTCLTPLPLIALGTVGQAQTVISTRLTSPVATATAANGQADSLRIASAGAVAPASGTAVTVNSSHNLTNEGTIEVRGANGAVGILVNPGTTTNIASSGQITIDENYTPADSDNDGDADGPFAQGTNRFAIRLAPGGQVTGNLTTSGTITVEGNSSAGIAADSRLVGNLGATGTISVTGNDSFGIRTTDVTGNLRVAGTVEARGGNAVGVLIGGNVGGAVAVQGTITATGYRATARPADTSKLDADDLLQGGPALHIAGNVAGGLLFDVPPADTNPNDPDEDKDGIPDASEGRAAITAWGASPAVLIGSADRSVAVGAIAGEANGHGLVNRGTIIADGVYAGVAANAVMIGGQGRDVTVQGGLTNAGTMRASAFNGSATALRIGERGVVNEIRNSGSIQADGASTANTRSRAIVIDQNAVVTAIRNSGTIDARATGAGSATAIVDRSGRLTLVENTGAINAAGATAAAQNIAIDTQVNGSGVIVRQLAATGANAAAPRIQGAILFGSGGDLLDVAAGSVTGPVAFGGGDNRLVLGGAATLTGDAGFGAGADRVTLGGSAQLIGALDLGGGADQIAVGGTARFRGAVSNAGGAAVTLTGGSFEIANTGPVALGSLSVGQGAVLGIAIDAATGLATRIDVAGTASFAQGSRLQVRVAEIGQIEGRFTVLRAGTLTGTPSLSVDANLLPYLYRGQLAAGTPAGELAVEIRRKTAAELGLNRAQAAAYAGVYQALLTDREIGNIFLGYADKASFIQAYDALLPDHGGGVFEAATLGSRTTARILADRDAPRVDRGGWGFWLQQSGWGTDKGRGQSAAYEVRGWGFAGGAEAITPAGSFGLSVAYLDSRNRGRDTDNSVGIGQYELGAYWRLTSGRLHAWARGSAGFLDMDADRVFRGRTAAGKVVSRMGTASWDGRLYSGAAGASYEIGFGRLALRPQIGVDYHRLAEDGYVETGTGAGGRLTVGRRSSDELAGTASATLGYLAGRADENWLRVELEAGRRQILGGRLGDTVARFGTGQSFTLAADQRTDGWLGRLRVLGGSPGFTLGGDASVEQQQGRAVLSFRASLRIGM